MKEADEDWMKRNLSESRSEKEQREGHSVLVLQEQNKGSGMILHGQRSVRCILCRGVT